MSAVIQNNYTQQNNSTVLYNFTFPYLKASDIKVSLDAVATTAFTLDSAATFTGEVIAIADGITQATDSYTINADGDQITFLTAPNASNLTLKVVL